MAESSENSANSASAIEAGACVVSLPHGRIDGTPSVHGRADEGTLRLETDGWQAPPGARVVPLLFKIGPDGSRENNGPRFTVEIDGEKLPMPLDTGACTILTPAALQAVGDRGPAMRATRSPINPAGPLVILYADGLAETQGRLEDVGTTIVKPVFAYPGGRRFHFQDLDGYELAVWSDK